MINLAIVGATGLVGGEMIKVLEEFHFAYSSLFLFASPKSAGKPIKVNEKEYFVKSIEEIAQHKIDIAIFSAGSEVSGRYAPILTEKGTFVIDNSSQWRMFDNVPLVVPEINADKITKETKIIANPNCSTIQMVLALSALHKKYHIKRLVVSTYQSVTGTGMKAVNQLMAERKNEACEKIYPHPIDLNCFPHGGTFLENGYTTEEMKLVNETRKILDEYSIKITATVVRIPVIGGHSEAVNVEFHKPFEVDEVKQLLAQTPGIVVMDEPQKNIYPTPQMAKGKNEVFVGRIRRDDSVENGLNLWIVADNLRKGAATNAVQIAQYVAEKFFHE